MRITLVAHFNYKDIYLLEVLFTKKQWFCKVLAHLVNNFLSQNVEIGDRDK
jgi:hypothetical protein